MTGAEGVEEGPLQGGEEEGDFGGEEGHGLPAEGVEAVAVLRIDAYGIAEGCGVAVDQGEEQGDDDGDGGEEVERVRRAPGGGVAGEIEVSGDSVGEAAGAGQGGDGDEGLVGEGEEGEEPEEFAHGVLGLRRVLS